MLVPIVPSTVPLFTLEVSKTFAAVESPVVCYVEKYAESFPHWDEVYDLTLFWQQGNCCDGSRSISDIDHGMG